MSQNNNENGQVGTVVGFAGAGLLILFFFMFALLAFVAFAGTLLALFAWNNPIRLSRKIVITPEDARGFIARGIAGALVVPLFGVFCSILLGIRFVDEFWLYAAIGGYALGSIVVGIMLADGDEPAAPGAAGLPQIIPPQQSPQLPVQNGQGPWGPAPSKPPFRFASWDDEDELRR